jgi:hypothetical protein
LTLKRSCVQPSTQQRILSAGTRHYLSMKRGVQILSDPEHLLDLSAGERCAYDCVWFGKGLTTWNNRAVDIACE